MDKRRKFKTFKKISLICKTQLIWNLLLDDARSVRCNCLFLNWNLDLHQVQVCNPLSRNCHYCSLLLFCCYSFIFGCKTWPKVILAAKPELTWLWSYYTSIDSTRYEYSYVLLQWYCPSSDGDITLLYSMLLNYISTTPKFWILKYTWS